MRTTSEAAALRAAFYAVLAEMPPEKLRKLFLELLLAPLTWTTQHRKRGRQPTAVAEGNVVPLPRKNGRRRRRKTVDEAKLAERRKRNAANRKARRQAAKAEAAAAATTAGNGNGQGLTLIESFWRHAQTLDPQAPWKPVMREFGTNEAAARHAFRTNALPPHVGPVAVERFLTLQT
jgi:hypothetical protein